LHRIWGWAARRPRAMIVLCISQRSLCST
jgi:hypothetical protein